MKMNQEHKPCGETSSGTLYKIGAFASMNRVTVKALRFYEEQGLLSPAAIDSESGYRYYTLNQMATLHQISALKQAGFTLEEIAGVNNGADEEAIIIKKNSEFLAEIAKLTSQVAALDGYLAKKRGSFTAPVLIKSIPECTIAYVQTKLDSYDCLFEKMPAIQAACIFHKGSYNTLAEAYETVLKYALDNDYEIVGKIRENYIDGVWNKESENEWLTEIQVPVRKIEKER